MAAARFNQLAGPDGPVAGSAGVAAHAGQPASPAAIEAAAALYGLRLESHRSVPLDEPLMQMAGLVVAMTPSHRDWILLRYPAYADKVHVLTAFGKEGDMERGIRDPFGGTVQDYRDTLLAMEPHIRALIAYIRSTGPDAEE
jgi:protein-tyrosine-phosphatase